MRLLIGGSPCTYWSIAQTKNRETEASGMGWELFKNYVISRDKFQPDYFLYENNKSMSPKIRAQITQMLGVEPVLINSALVSAQNRQRLYWVGHRRQDGTYERVQVEQPEDRGILLRDVLESGVCWREKAYTLRASEGGKIADSHAVRTITTRGKEACDGVAEPVNDTDDGKCHTLKAQYYKNGVANFVTNGGFLASAVAEPVRVGCLPNADGEVTNSQGERIYSTDGKARSLLASMSGGNSNESSPSTGLYAEPVRVGTIESAVKNADFDSQQYRVYSPDGKSVTLCGNGGGVGAKTGLYACPSDGKTLPVYKVRDGLITIKGKQYPIKLRDGCYIIRKLTVTECKRLQTVPEWYVFPVSDSQAYKMLGNGWTVEVIMHLMRHFDGITNKPLDVLSMYDGMGCGHIALDKLGASIRHYWATEIDKFAIKTATHNFPNIVELGDAFQVRAEDWRIG